MQSLLVVGSADPATQATGRRMIDDGELKPNRWKVGGLRMYYARVETVSFRFF